MKQCVDCKKMKKADNCRVCYEKAKKRIERIKIIIDMPVKEYKKIEAIQREVEGC